MHQDGLQQLQHGGNARSTGQQSHATTRSLFEWLAQGFGTKFALAVILQMSLGPLDQNGIANLERIQMLAHQAALGKFRRQGSIHFNHQLHLIDGGIVRHGCIRPLHRLARGRIGEFERQVLPDGQTQDVRASAAAAGKSQGESTGIMTQDFFLNQGKGRKVGQGQHFGWTRCLTHE
ncbi:hypothetical protein ACA910_009459 [Epithemia clementina (nom. ined.)]